MNIRFVLFFVFILVFNYMFNHIMAQSLTTVKGLAPHALGKEVTIHEITDYLTHRTVEVASTNVKTDSTFQLTFYNDKVQKYKVNIGKDYFYIYASPSQSYNLFVKEVSNYNARRPEGEEVGFYFFDLDSTDINHKILFFEDRQFDFLTKNYTKNMRETEGFVKALEAYKQNVELRYKLDTCSFFKTYVQFAVASLDNLAFIGNRNKFEKFDFFIKYAPISYHNDRYMEYVFNYFHNYPSQLSPSVNEAFYNGVIRSSPTLIINKIGGDYALGANLKLRELVMIKMLGDVYYTKEYPQTNILTILDSVSTNGLFESNRLIAANLKNRLTALVKGGLMPDFLITINGEKKNRNDFIGKHVYLNFINVTIDKSVQDLKLLSPLYQKYGEVVDFLTILVVPSKEEFDEKEFLKSNPILWNYSIVEAKDNIIERSNVSTYPYYVLLDAQGYVVAAPALTPRPNNEYETIERFLFSIKKIRDKEKEEEEKRRRKGPVIGN